MEGIAVPITFANPPWRDLSHIPIRIPSVRTDTRCESRDHVRRNAGAGMVVAVARGIRVMPVCS